MCHNKCVIRDVYWEVVCSTSTVARFTLKKKSRRQRTPVDLKVSRSDFIRVGRVPFRSRGSLAAAASSITNLTSEDAPLLGVLSVRVNTADEDQM